MLKHFTSFRFAAGFFSSDMDWTNSWYFKLISVSKQLWQLSSSPTYYFLDFMLDEWEVYLYVMIFMWLYSCVYSYGRLMNNEWCKQPFSLINHVRYVGVIWFVFQVLWLLLFRFTQQNSCCISKSTMTHVQKL